MFKKEYYKINDNFIDVNVIKNIATSSKCATIVVDISRQYRPDLIAYDLYNDISMADFLAIINEIDDTPFGFYSGRKIKVLKPEYKDMI